MNTQHPTLSAASLTHPAFAAAAQDPSAVRRHLEQAVASLGQSQRPSGSWKGDYAGPLFLPALYTLAYHATNTPLPDDVRSGMVVYLRRVQSADGGFGLGEENPSCVFTTALNYVVMRWLGVPADDADATRARTWLAAHGGPLAGASWGPFILAMWGLAPWEAVDPVPPELWLVPESLPVHPGKLWCHARMVYLPMSYLYARRATFAVHSDLHTALVNELYGCPWSEVVAQARAVSISHTDVITPRTPLMRAAHVAMRGFEKVAPAALRKRAMDVVLDHIRYEDEITDSICIGPVNKVYNTLVWQLENPGSERVVKHMQRLPTYLHMDELGARMNGYDSSELWDTAFAVQALSLAERAAVPGVQPVLAEAYRYVDDSQVREDPPEMDRWFRCRSKGGWPFSTREHGWPITDCTAEGLKATVAVRGQLDTALGDDRLVDSVERMLEWQNTDGGWASYEQSRAPAWLEWLNPSDCFRGIMVDVSYTECSSACVQALAQWQRREGATPDVRVDEAVSRGQAYLRGQQRPDGLWLGCWGVCFTYGTWFGVHGLIESGVSVDDPAIQRAVRGLLSIRLPDGGWGEDVEACRLREPVPTPGSQAVMTGFAVLTLLKAQAHRDPEVAAVIAEAVGWLMQRQGIEGDPGAWPRERVAGVFNGTCSIQYDMYRQVFSVWALAAWMAVQAGEAV